MKYTQNDKIMQVTEGTLIVGVDIARDVHYARAIDIRGYEYCKTVSFENTKAGFEKFENWIKSTQESSGKTDVMVGVEPTGPYWFCLARYLKDRNYEIVTVNPYHVKQTKEISDNNPTKNDKKDAKLIAKLVKDGNFNYPNFLDEKYEALRNLTNRREELVKDISRISNRTENWLDRYFTEYREIFKDWSSISFIHILEEYSIPSEIGKYTAQEIYDKFPVTIRRAMGKKRTEKLVYNCKNSIAIKGSIEEVKLEIKQLLEQYKLILSQIEEVEKRLSDAANNLEETKKIMKIKGIGEKVATGIVAELGDISSYSCPEQLYKVAGLNLKENSSGLRKGKTSITKRGRSKLRKVLYQGIFSAIVNNDEIKQIYNYYRQRNINPLTGKQAIIAICRKLLRIIYVMVKKDLEYDKEKMLSDIKRPKEFKVKVA